MQILKSIYQVGGDLNGITFDGVDAGYNDGNTYIIARPDGLIMFDTGCGDTMEQIFNNMRYWDLDPDDIKYCFLTHPHYDHTAGGSFLKERGVKFISIAETADAVSKGDDRKNIVKEITGKLTEWLMEYEGKLRIPLWKIVTVHGQQLL